MKKRLYFIFILSVLSFSFLNAKEVQYLIDKDIPILKGSKIKVTNYDNYFKVYEIVSVNHPSEGFSYTKLHFLKDAAKNFNHKIFKEFPQKLVGQELVLKNNLVTLAAPNEVPEEDFSSQ